MGNRSLDSWEWEQKEQLVLADYNLAIEWRFVGIWRSLSCYSKFRFVGFRRSPTTSKVLSRRMNFVQVTFVLYLHPRRNLI